ncbi:hypothetical protein QJQ45_024370 [Haematococcus lacustris]|nr:hypothetical protein QJQ45_024370 [Haematococcus lacustris]
MDHGVWDPHSTWRLGQGSGQPVYHQDAQPLSTTPLPPTPPVLSSLPPAPPLPPPAASNASSLIKLQFTFFGLDLYSLVTWESSVEALVAAQPSSMTMQSLAAPGTCYSHLQALNTSALLNTSLTAQQLMPGLDLFVSDVGPVARVLHSYLQDRSVTVKVADFCAGPRTESTFYTYLPTTLHSGPWPTLLVSVHLLPQDLDGCRGALMTRGSQFFVFYQMPFQRCFAQLLVQPATPPAEPPPPAPPSPPASPPHRVSLASQSPDPPSPTWRDSTDNPALFFGPITGDGRTWTFSSCIPGAPNWIAVMWAQTANTAAELFRCGGTATGVSANALASAQLAESGGETQIVQA